MKWFLIVSDLLIPMIILGILCNGRAYGGSRNLKGFRLADLSVGRNRKVYKMDWLSGRIGAAYSCKDVFFFGSNRFAIRYL